MMRQLPEENVDAQASLMSLAGGGDTLTTVLLFVNLVASFGMQKILGMVRALQIIILLPLLQSGMPANTGMFLNQIA